ncbi:1-phosphatidylinositol 4,5-bisphosphate phosphodiesterase beta-1 [Gossypium australe]|uniref:1-phosphatidylinositol 4,5-bisphosphate phosphodiesterase beta-1 n=1 Tax=Gossypium australe TaxID=47621 RepID=A0A5B6WMF5_9ROSI|nr:1-phosphatidylinositol 4,5-bisphosphate phosphodiesterase beta-1 [Gossypium australe]
MDGFEFSVAVSLLYVEIKGTVLRRVFSQIVNNFWSEWELRLMVLLSLVLHFLLIHFGKKRKKYTGALVPLIAICAWIIYLSADWMATLVLSTLLRGSVGLEKGLVVFWTPFLLWHLGGPYNITAYSLEDNELWLRHFLGMFFQIGEAIYISVRFQSDTELNSMAVPLFIAGVLKYFERTWALRCASPKQLMKSFYVTESSKSPIDSSCDGDEKNTMIRTGLYDLSRMKRFIEDPIITDEVKFLRLVHSAFDVFKPLLTDRPFQISEEFHEEWVYLKRYSMNAAEAFNFVKIELEFLYDLLFTKNPLHHQHYICNLALRLICFSSAFSALIAFSALYYKFQDHTVDFVVTYVLLFSAVFLESSSFHMYIRSKWTLMWHANRKNKLKRLYLWFAEKKLRSIKSKKGLRRMAQHDLLGYYLKAKTSQITRALKSIDFINLLQRFWYSDWKDVDIELKEFIYDYLKNMRTELSKEQFSPKHVEKMLGEKGDAILERKGFDPIVNDDWKMESTDFTRRIFIWHIATSLVYYDDLSKHRMCSCGSISKIGKSLSDYMMYLVLVRPTMLPKGFSDMVNDETYNQTQRIPLQLKPKQTAMMEFMEILWLQPSDAMLVLLPEVKFGALLEGVKFAKKLQGLITERWDHEEKWKMISDIWMEMMVYGASRCTWEEHAQQLRHGSELLTHVALIMAHLGLSTQVHKQEKTDDTKLI